MLNSLSADQSPRPSFILGCHRSGTTLVRYFLDVHPDLACPPETKFLAGLNFFLKYPQAVSGLRSLGLTDQDIFALVRQLANDVFGHYLTRHSKRRWIDKTPNYLTILPFIDEVFDQTAQYICIVRHPFDCMISLRTFFGATKQPHQDPEIRSITQRFGSGLYAWAQYWHEMNSYLTSFMTTSRSRCLLVKYEDLVMDAEAVGAKILEFLDVERSEGDVRRMWFKAFTATHAPGFGDEKIRNTGSVHVGSIGGWKDWTVSEVETYWGVVGDLANGFGYARQPPSENEPRQ